MTNNLQRIIRASFREISSRRGHPLYEVLGRGLHIEVSKMKRIDLNPKMNQQGGVDCTDQITERPL